MDDRSGNISSMAKEIVITIVGLPLLYGFVILLTQKAHERHWLLGIAATLFLAYLIYLGLKDLRSPAGRKFSLLKGMRIFFLLVLVTAITFASISFLLFQFGWADYATNSPPTLYNFNAFYIGVFLDLLPGIEVRNSLGWTELPVQPEGVVAGLPVIAFRTLVIFGLLGSLRIWWSGES